MYRGGIVDFVRHLNATKDPIHKSVIGFSVKGTGIEVEIAMQWNATYAESVYTFANTINTHEGGTHEEGFRAALTSLVNKYAQDKNLLKEKDDNLTGDDIREGLAAIVSVKLSNPQFEGQTKTKLGNTEAKKFVQKACNDWLEDWLERNPAEARTIVNKASSAAQRPHRGPGGARAGPAQGAARRGLAARQAGRLPVHRPEPVRALHRRGRQRRRLGQVAAATRCSRRSCRSAARSSTSRRRGSTGS